jgi:uncharacterized protein (DUF1501 family)
MPRRGDKFFAFLASDRLGLQRGADLRIVFGIGGERDLSRRDCRIWRAGGAAAGRVGSGWLRRQLDGQPGGCSARPGGCDQLRGWTR